MRVFFAVFIFMLQVHQDPASQLVIQQWINEREEMR